MKNRDTGALKMRKGRKNGIGQTSKERKQKKNRQKYANKERKPKKNMTVPVAARSKT
jgi:hypothetical protein